MTPEGKVAACVKRLAKEHGGETRKVAWVGRRGAPDLLVMLPGVSFFVETKAPGQKPRPEQLREFARLHRAGLYVFVVDSEESAEKVFSLFEGTDFVRYLYMSSIEKHEVQTTPIPNEDH